MERFRNGQRVKVTTADLTEGISMLGKVGSVVRIRTDGSAWLEMDESLPDKLASFPDGDHRRNHMVFYSDECEPLNLRLT